AARNPCPCGFYGDGTRPCSCPEAMVTRYQKRLSGPILDRIDLHLTVARVDFDKLTSTESGESADVVRARVTAARRKQWRRFAEHNGVTRNADTRVPDVRVCGELHSGGAPLVRGAVERLSVGAGAC